MLYCCCLALLVLLLLLAAASGRPVCICAKSVQLLNRQAVPTCRLLDHFPEADSPRLGAMNDQACNALLVLVPLVLGIGKVRRSHPVPCLLRHRRACLGQSLSSCTPVLCELCRSWHQHALLETWHCFQSCRPCVSQPHHLPFVYWITLLPLLFKRTTQCCMPQLKVTPTLLCLAAGAHYPSAGAQSRCPCHTQPSTPPCGAD